MVPRPFYRAVFALGVATFLSAFGLGVLQAWRTSGRPPELLYDELGEGRDATAAGDLATAERQLRTYALLQPEMSDGWVRLGQFLQKKGDRPGAIAAFERALQILPQPIYAYQALAILYYQEGDVPRARELARFALEHGGKFTPEVHQALDL